MLERNVSSELVLVAFEVIEEVIEKLHYAFQEHSLVTHVEQALLSVVNT